MDKNTKRKIKVMILTTRFGGPYKWAREFKEYAKDNNLPLEIKIRSNIFSLLLSPFYVGDCDVVHTIQPLTFRLWKKPVLLNIRGDYKNEISIRNIWALFYKKAIKKADIVVVPSKYLKLKLNLQDIEVIPNCIDPKKYPEKKDYSIKDKIKIIMVTSLAFEDKAKGVLSLIKILKKVNKKNITFTVLGGGNYLKKIKTNVKKMHIPENIRIEFMGKVSNVNDFLKKSDMFTYYSTHDNFPNSIIEAMACGLPVITNKVGAVEEMIENGKDGFISKNDEDYILTLNKLINNDSRTRSKIGRKARDNVNKKFNWKNSTKQWYKIYRKLNNAQK